MVGIPPTLLGEFENAVLGEAVECLKGDDRFCQSTTRREQCAHACRILREDHIPVVPFALIGAILGVDKSTVRKEWKLWLEYENMQRPHGRHPILSNEVREDLIRWITAKWRVHEPVTHRQARLFLSEKWGITVIPNTMSHIIRCIPEIRCCDAFPMEAERMNVPDQAVYTWFENLSRSIDGVPPHFVFNMDEMGHQDYADAKVKRCLLPAHVNDSRPCYEVSRRGKRITLIGCVVADGSYLRPALIVSRSTYEDEVLEYGLTEEKLEVYSQKHAFIDRDIFFDWMKDTFAPALEIRRQIHHYAGPAYLLLDNCSAHFGPDISQLCTAHNVHLLFIPPHSSHFLQCLDVCIFGLTKRIISSLNRTEDVNIQTQHLIKMVNGFLAAATPTNIIKSFKNAGISVTRNGRSLACLATIATVRLFRPREGEPAHAAIEPNPNHIPIPENLETHDVDGYIMNCAAMLPEH
jgi:hypothetical protein